MQYRGLKDITLFGVSYLTVQALFMLFRTKIGNVLGIYKLVALSGLSLLVTILAKVASGDPLLTVLSDAQIGRAHV